MTADQASGRLGPFILRAVQADPAFHVTAITRESSTSTFPDGTTVIRVGDNYPDAQMENVLSGQDAVVLSLGFGGEHNHSKLVRAAIRAGVQRVIGSDYGCYNECEAARQVFPTAAKKFGMVQELRSLEQDGWTWTNICCGFFFDLFVMLSGCYT